MRTSRRSRSGSSASLLRWLGKVVAQPKEPERPQKRTWPDVVATALLLPLGLGAVVSGIVFRAQLGRGWLHMPEIGIIVIVAGLVARHRGVGRSLAYLPVFRFAGDDEDFPTILWALPFFVFGMACFMVSVFGIEDVRDGRLGPIGLGLVVAGIGSMFLSVLIVIGIAFGRAAVALWRRFDKMTRDPENRS